MTDSAHELFIYHLHVIDTGKMYMQYELPKYYPLKRATFVQLPRWNEYCARCVETTDRQIALSVPISELRARNRSEGVRYRHA